MITFDSGEFTSLLPVEIARAVVERASKEIAGRFLAEHAQEILAALDPQAVANLAIAGAGGEIATALRQKLPDKIVEVVRREVYQRGVFGGLHRVG